MKRIEQFQVADQDKPSSSLAVPNDKPIYPKYQLLEIGDASLLASLQMKSGYRMTVEKDYKTRVKACLWATPRLCFDCLVVPH